MKYLRFFCLFLFLLIAIPSVSGLTVFVDTPSDLVTVGESVQIPVRVKDAENIHGFVIQYPRNSTLMSVAPYLPKEEDGKAPGLYDIDISSSSVKFASLSAISGNQTLFYLDVTPNVEQNMSIDITVKELATFDATNTPVHIQDFTVQNGTLFVQKTKPIPSESIPSKPAPSKPVESIVPPVSFEPTPSNDVVGNNSQNGSNQTDTQRDPSIPGFEMIGGFAGLCLVRVLMKKRNG